MPRFRFRLLKFAVCPLLFDSVDGVLGRQILKAQQYIQTDVVQPIAPQHSSPEVHPVGHSAAPNLVRTEFDAKPDLDGQVLAQASARLLQGMQQQMPVEATPQSSAIVPDFSPFLNGVPPTVLGKIPDATLGSMPLAYVPAGATLQTSTQEIQPQPPSYAEALARAAGLSTPSADSVRAVQTAPSSEATYALQPQPMAATPEIGQPAAEPRDVQAMVRAEEGADSAVVSAVSAAREAAEAAARAAESAYASVGASEQQAATVSASEEAADELRPEFSYDHSLNFVLAVPKYKLLFCYIPKNACSQFNGFINELNGLSASGSPWFGSSALRHFGWSKEQLVERLRSEDWYKAIFVRDPLERALSGYLSKCLPGADGSVEDWGSHCLGYEQKVRKGTSPSFLDFLDNLDQLHKSPEGMVDAHFRHQHDFCGGVNISDYDFIGNFNEDINPQVRTLLKGVGAGASTPLAEKYFPPADPETEGGNRLTSASHPLVFNSNYNKAELLSSGYRLYKSDYQRFPALRKKHKANNVCITCLYALDFEKRRTLDWIAYHNLMGVNCFLLFLDRDRANLADPEVKKIYDHLLASRIVTVLDTDGQGDRIPKPDIMADLATVLGIHYLMTLDGDEFAVLDGAYPTSAELLKGHSVQLLGTDVAPMALPTLDAMPLTSQGSSMEARGTLAAPPNLRAYLDAKVSRAGALGVYMHRWDYGTSGFVDPPSLIASPEFAVLTERVGTKQRSAVPDRHGKVVLNLASGSEYVGVHTWTVPQDGGVMLLPNGTAFTCKPECLCGELCNGNQEASPKCDYDCMPRTAQELFINHYVTGSLQECEDKQRRSVWDRRSMNECNRLHPGTEQYRAQAERTGFTRDDVLVKYAAAVRVRRVELFLAQ